MWFASLKWLRILTMARLLLNLLICVLLSGCYFVSFEDVSDMQPYSEYVGKQYRASQKIYIHRVSLDRDYGPEPSYYSIYKKPMASGPEVLGQATLPADTTFEVLKVLRCVNCYLDFGERVEAVVSFTSTNSFRDRKVKVSTDLLGDPFIKVPDSE